MLNIVLKCYESRWWCLLDVLWGESKVWKRESKNNRLLWHCGQKRYSTWRWNLNLPSLGYKDLSCSGNRRWLSLGQDHATCFTVSLLWRDASGPVRGVSSSKRLRTTPLGPQLLLMDEVSRVFCSLLAQEIEYFYLLFFTMFLMLLVFVSPSTLTFAVPLNHYHLWLSVAFYLLALQIRCNFSIKPPEPSLHHHTVTYIDVSHDQRS